MYALLHTHTVTYAAYNHCNNWVLHVLFKACELTYFHSNDQTTFIYPLLWISRSSTLVLVILFWSLSAQSPPGMFKYLTECFHQTIENVS